MSKDQPTSATRRGFLGAATVATAATAATLTTSPIARGQQANEIRVAQTPHGNKTDFARLTDSKGGRLVQTGGHGDPQRGSLQAGTGSIRPDLSPDSGKLRLLDPREGQARTRSSDSRVRQYD